VFAEFAAVTSKSLVKSRWNEVVNIRSTKTVEDFFVAQLWRATLPRHLALTDCRVFSHPI
jgi:hypothetical protein